MKKVIEIDLDNKLEYLNKYNDNIINDELHNYILSAFDDVNKNILLKVKFNYNIDKDERLKVALVFKDSFSIELDNIQKKLKKRNIRDAVLLVLGFLFLIIYCYLDDFDIFLIAEFFMVISWGSFWEFAESLLFGRKKLIVNKKKYEKLINTEIEIVDQWGIYYEEVIDNFVDIYLLLWL